MHAIVLRLSALVLTSAAIVSGVTPVRAQPANDPFATTGKGAEWSVTAGIGGALRPTFEGSDRYFVTPVPFISAVWRDTVSLDTSGLNAYWRMDDLQIGGGLTFSLGRNQNSGVFTQGDSRLNGLGDIPAAVGMRGFVNYRMGPVLLSSTFTKFLAEGNNGFLIDAGIGVPWRVSDRLMLMGRISATWADSNYMQQYFGITAQQSANSGYALYDTSSGVKDVALGATLRYRLTDRWLFSTNARVSQLTNYAAGSPISFSDTNFTLMSLLGYRF